MMKKKQLYIFICCVFLLLNFKVLFSNEMDNFAKELELHTVVEELNDYVEGLNLQDMSEGLMRGEGVKYEVVGKNIVKNIKEALTSSKDDMIFILLFIVVVSILKALELEKDSSIAKVINVITILVIVTYMLNIYADLLSIVRKTVEIQSSILQTVSPFLMSMLILTGAITTTGIVQPILLLLIQVINFSVNYIIIPLITISVVFNVITNISEGISLKKIGSMCNKTSMWLNAVLLTIFLGIISLGTTVSTSVDSVTVKTTQSAISSVIPVVGKFVSDSVEFVFGASEVIAKTAGVISLIVLVIVLIVPVIKMLITIIIASLITAIAESINIDDKTVKLLDGFVDAFKTIFGVLISTSVTFIISIAVILSLVGKVLS